jgi:hypothetical protein
MNIVVTRLEKYPRDNPAGWCVGFNVETTSGRSFYLDCTISFDEAEDDDAAVAAALDLLGDQIKSRVDDLDGLPSLLGTDVTDRLDS